ncbi:MAG: adenylate/guanylate cyclase domain-containing protein [Winogradskyella sp.]|uniref:adenylate/guanylate cyclase domain-containing protein n=1 Tax=Winogradskyella sp. TaxID=1883156 RepID=UPI000F41EB40|nr:adenylate/guanylate cyclase domain-containing protein [Winogradskyella sp.]RNC86234.1 MAG: adenylate/guanylate cyclase domain-containing protein [Winogradskyella sp.]
MTCFKKISTFLAIKTYIIVGFFCCFSITSFSQNIKESDSLERELKSGMYEGEAKLDLLRKLAGEETDVEKQLQYSQQLIIEAKELNNSEREFDGYLQQGNAFQQKGDLTTALESYFKASKLAKENDLAVEEAEIDLAIAAVYSTMNDHDSSFEYYREGLTVLRKLKDTVNILTAELNIGDEFYKIKELDSSLHYANIANELNKTLENENSEFHEFKDFFQAYINGLFGLINVEKGEVDEANDFLNKAITTLSEYGDYEAVCEYTGALSDMYYNNGQISTALKYAKQSLELAQKNGLKDEIGQGLLKLSNIYEDNGNIRRAFTYYKDHIKYRDSVTNVAEFQKQNKMRTEDAVYDSEKAKEAAEEQQRLLEKQKRQQYYIIAIITIGLIIIGFLARKFLMQSKVLEKQKGIIEFEKHRSEDLLKNILPEETAEELKEHGTVKAKKFDNVSVLFTDFKGFTAQSEKLSPEDLVKSIDYYFSKFDEIVDKFKLEKIKTIGDSYMCAGGLPFPIEHQAARVCQAALEMAEFVKVTKRSITHNLAKFDIRIGIHTGPVVAGVVGTKKFQYDIWGDTVNTAARMESSGEIGRVNISQHTHELLQSYDVFKFEQRGAIEAKGKGKIEMYFVDYLV